MLYPFFIKCSFGREVKFVLSQIMGHAQHFSKTSIIYE